MATEAKRHQTHWHARRQALLRARPLIIRLVEIVEPWPALHDDLNRTRIQIDAALGATLTDAL